MNAKKADVIITRHPTMLAYLKEIGLADDDTPHYTHASPYIVRGKNVVGVLPLWLASLCKSITVVPLKISLKDRGAGELTLNQIRNIAQDPETYVVRRIAE